MAATCYTNLVGQCATALTATAARYLGITNVVSAFGTTFAGQGDNIVIPGNAQTYTISDLYISQDTPIGAGSTRTWVVSKNNVDTALTCTIAGAAQTANSDLTHSFTVTSGDEIAIKTTADAATSTGTTRWSIRATATTNKNMSCSGGSSSTVSAAATNYIPVQGFAQSATVVDVEQVMPNAGTLQNAQCSLTAAPGAGTSYAITLVKNGSDTAITFTVADTATVGSDTTHTVSYVQGDRFYWKSVPTGPPVARGISVSLETVATVPGESVHLEASSSAWLNSAVRYDALSVPASSGHGTTESVRQVVTQPAVWKKLSTYNNTASGSGAKTWLVELVKNGTAGNPSVTFNNTTGLTADNTNTITTVGGDTLSFKTTPTGTPTGTTGGQSVVSYIAANTLSFSWKVRSEPNSSGTQTHITQPTVPWNAGQQNDYFIEGIYEPKDS